MIFIWIFGESDYAKVSVIHNTKENFMPVFEGSAVYTANEDDIQVALGLDSIDEKTAIPAGLMKAGNNVSVPLKYNGDFLIGPEGAHMNISGISGLATKTSYVMFLLKAIQHKCKDDVAIIVMNVKGDDLLHVHQPNEKITESQRQDWADLGVPCTPFENVKYLYPYRQQKDKLYANTALPTADLAEQFDQEQAANFVYTFEHDINKVDILIDQPEDDLDNKVIYDEVITAIVKKKPDIQFIFATHNANIPVLGDAERILTVEFQDTKIDISQGNIDLSTTHQQIVDIMEGGKEAFDKRQLIYTSWS